MADKGCLPCCTLALLKEMDIPVVLVDRDVSSSNGRRSEYDLVGIDNFAAGYQLGELMVPAPHTRRCPGCCRCGAALELAECGRDQDW